MGAGSWELGAGSREQGDRSSPRRVRPSADTATSSVGEEVSGQNASCSSKLVGTQSTSLDDALKGADWDRLAAVHGDNYLSTVWMAPFLMTAFLAHLAEAAFAQHLNNVFSAANGKALAHVSATSSTFAPADNVTGAGSNQSSKASLALRTASSSVSPAEAHPGNSGKNAAQRLVSESCSTTSRSFIAAILTPCAVCGNGEVEVLSW